tara:strand:+ start:1331 stop:4561 length:3231 start_codon:yes stop_codon:yes gene_type:complete
MITNVAPESLVGSVAPNVYVSNVLLAKGSCALTLSVKDVYDKSFLGRWSNNEELYRQFKIKIIRSLSTTTTEKLSSLQNGVQILTAAKRPKMMKETFQHDLLLANQSKQGLNAASSIYTDKRGYRIEGYPLSFIDDELPESIEHLTYFIVMYYDLFESTHTKTPLSGQDLVGTPLIEKVIDNGNAVNTGLVYVLEEDQTTVWAGAVHTMPNGEIHTAATHTAKSQVLVAQPIENLKIQDFRAVDDLRGFSLDFSTPQSTDFPLPLGDTKILSHKYIPVVDENAIFTDLYPSADSDGNVRFFFGVDYDNLIAQKTKFGKIYKKLTNLSSVDQEAVAPFMVESEIRRITLKRRRVEAPSESNWLGSPVNNKGKFDEEEIDKILLTAEFQDGVPVATSTLDSGLRSLNVHTTGPSDGFRYFTGYDGTLKKNMFGLYRYEIELELRDRSSEIVDRMLSALTAARESLVRYLNAGSLPVNYDYDSDRFRRTFFTVGGGSSFSWSAALREYANVLTVLGLISETTTRQDLDLAPRGRPRHKSSLEIQRILKPLVYSATANLGTVSRVISLVDSLLSEVSNFFGAHPPSGGGTSSSSTAATDHTRHGQISRSASALSKRVLVSHFFETQFDASVSQDVGYDYLTKDAVHTGLEGLYTIGSDTFLERGDLETLKYFKGLDKNIDVIANGKNYTKGDSLRNSDLKYLSPSSVRVFGATQDLSSELTLSSLQYQKVEKNLFYYNLQSRLIGVPPGESNDTPGCELQEQERLTAQQYGISDLTQPERETYNFFFEVDMFKVEGEPLVAPSVEEPSFPAGVLSKVSPLPIASSLSGLIRAMANAPKQGECIDIESCQPGIDLYNTTLTCNELFTSLDTSSTVDSATSLLIALPNQVKSVILGNTTTNTVNLNWFESENPIENDVLGSTYRLSLEALRAVEALTGFEVSKDNQKLARTPVFELISNEFLAAAPQGAAIICRLSPYTDERFALNGLSNNLKLPIYNEYFIIRKVGPATRSSAPQETNMGIKTAAAAPQVGQRLSVLDLAQYSRTQVFAPKGITPPTPSKSPEAPPGPPTVATNTTSEGSY